MTRREKSCLLDSNKTKCSVLQMTKKVVIVGGGLAGTEAAWQLASRGHAVRLFEMRPKVSTGAHTGGALAELVCSNSLGSNLVDRASGLLKEEAKRLGSMLLQCAEVAQVPAGDALAVDREVFSQAVTEKLESNPHIEIIREEITQIPDAPCIIASGPLTSPSFSKALMAITGQDHLYFFDALAPIVAADSIDFKIAFRASRRREDEGPGDYINCPFTREEYEKFVTELLAAERIPLKSFEEAMSGGVKAGAFFEGCLPAEIIASRGFESLAFGPMRPVGLIDPRTGRRPHAVLQLRQDNIAGSLYNLVGFQTNLKFPEQERVFRLVPGLEKVEFVRFGQMHRNTFVNSPTVLEPTLQLKNHPGIFLAGQITGVEGYMGNIATGMLAGINLARILEKKAPLALPATTMLGALCHYITHAEAKHFQPMKANFGIFPELPPIIGRKKIPKVERAQMYAKRALQDLETYVAFSQ